jgi:membrane protease YdiL (CAAX protease family)
MTNSKAADVLSITAISIFVAYSFSIFRDIYLFNIISKYVLSSAVVSTIIAFITLLFIISLDYYLTKLCNFKRKHTNKTVAFGLGIVVLVTTCECIFGTVILRNIRCSTIANTFFTFLAVALLEEELFRKILFEELSKSIPLIGASILCTLAFVFPHIILMIINKNIDIFSIVCLSFIGIIFLEIYIRFGLVCSIVLHTIWNVIAEGKLISNHEYIFYYSLILGSISAFDIIRNRKNLTIASTLTTRPDTQSAS